MLHLPDAWVAFECPKCGYGIDIQLVDAKAEATVFCHNYKVAIKLSDKEASVHSGLDQIDAAMRAFREIDDTKVYSPTINFNGKTCCFEM